MRARPGSGTIAGLMVGELVREALESYFHAKERARLEQGLGVASQLVRKESMRILEEFEPVDEEALESAEGHHP